MNAISAARALEHVAAGNLSSSLGEWDIAVDLFVLAYRTEIARIVAEMSGSRGNDLEANVCWSYEDEWALWALRSLYNRARRDGVGRLRLFADTVGEQQRYKFQGENWRDSTERRGHLVRIVMPDAFDHVLRELADSAVIRSLAPGLLATLREAGADWRADRHQDVFDSMQ